MNECAIARGLKSGKPRFRDSPNLGIDKSLNLVLYLTSQKIHEFSGLNTTRNKTALDKKSTLYRLIRHINVLFCMANAEINVIGNYIHMLGIILKEMRIIILTWILILSNICFSQKYNLIPADSSNYVIINDSIDQLAVFSNSNQVFSFKPRPIQKCPCDTSNQFGLISFSSSSNLIKRNNCFVIYKIDNDYLVKVGKMTKNKDKHGQYTWIFKTENINKDFAEKIIDQFKREISNSEIPNYDSSGMIPIVNDRIIYTFGDIDNQLFSISPISEYSESVIELIKVSENLIRQKFK